MITPLNILLPLPVIENEVELIQLGINILNSVHHEITHTTAAGRRARTHCQKAAYILAEKRTLLQFQEHLPSKLPNPNSGPK